MPKTEKECYNEVYVFTILEIYLPSNIVFVNGTE